MAIGEALRTHYGASRILGADASTGHRLLIGDYCYALGLCDLAEHGDLPTIRAFAATIRDVALTAGEPSHEQRTADRWRQLAADLPS